MVEDLTKNNNQSISISLFKADKLIKATTRKHIQYIRETGSSRVKNDLRVVKKLENEVKIDEHGNMTGECTTVKARIVTRYIIIRF